MNLVMFPALCLMLAVSGCVAPPPKKPVAVRKALPAKKTNFWKGDGVKGEPKIIIDLGVQRAYFFRDDLLVGETVISTGRKGFETPSGEYKVIQKDRNHSSNLYGQFVDADGAVVRNNVDVTRNKLPEGATFKGAKMPYFLRFHRGYGLHAGRVPGYRASHGCVRLPAEMARHVFNNSIIGTPVILQE